MGTATRRSRPVGAWALAVLAASGVVGGVIGGLIDGVAGRAPIGAAAGVAAEAAATAAGGAAAPIAAPAAGELVAASLLGGPGDRIYGAAILSDGSLVVGGVLSAGPVADKARELVAGKGVVARLSADGRSVLQAVRVGEAVRDLAVDGQDHIYVAGAEGVLQLDKELSQVLGQVKTPRAAVRIDVGPQGTVAALVPDKDNRSAPGAGQVLVLSPEGKEISRFPGYNNTLDICLHEPSGTVVLIGWRQARASDGKREEPVQIAYLRGYDLQGKLRWSNYDWSVDRNAPGFINRPENNMADTRGYRCCIGGDGKLYAAFECAGGNHIFRYEPRLNDRQEWVAAGGKRPRGDNYHEFHNSRAEHKLFFARYDPATGTYERGQQFCGRLANGRANAVRMIEGAIAADATGRLYLAGTAAAGLPLDFVPPQSGEYTGGNYLLVMPPDFRKRHWCTRLQAGAHTHALAVRRVNGKTTVLLGGAAASKPEPFPAVHALQPMAEPGSALVAVLRIE